MNPETIRELSERMGISETMAREVFDAINATEAIPTQDRGTQWARATRNRERAGLRDRRKAERLNKKAGRLQGKGK